MGDRPCKALLIFILASILNQLCGGGKSVKGRNYWVVVSVCGCWTSGCAGPDCGYERVDLSDSLVMVPAPSLRYGIPSLRSCSRSRRLIKIKSESQKQRPKRPSTARSSREQDRSEGIPQSRAKATTINPEANQSAQAYKAPNQQPPRHSQSPPPPNAPR